MFLNMIILQMKLLLHSLSKDTNQMDLSAAMDAVL